MAIKTSARDAYFNSESMLLCMHKTMVEVVCVHLTSSEVSSSQWTPEDLPVGGEGRRTCYSVYMDTSHQTNY